MRNVRKILKWCVYTLIFVGAVELILRANGFGPMGQQTLRIHPDTFFVSDPVLGWRASKGEFEIGKSNSPVFFKATLDRHGNRISSYDKFDKKSNLSPTIHVYGCESTFGYSVPDTATSCFKLQKMLPAYRVVNKACLGYGLAQMYLSVRQSVENGDTPTIAVFNYGSFQDERTPVRRLWSTLLYHSVIYNCKGYPMSMEYPYFEYQDDSLKLLYKRFSLIANDWPLRKSSAFVNLLNTLSDFISDKRDGSNRHLHLIAEKTAFEIMNYCKSNHIFPIFGDITPGSDDILQKLSMKGYDTLDYGIEVSNGDDAPNEYNGGVSDPQHPSGLAHSLYAQKIFNVILDKK